MSATPESGASGDHWVDISCSRHFASWLVEHSLSLAFTTYQSGKLFLIGTRPDRQVSIFERTFNRCMGLWANGQTMWMSSLYQLWRFANVLAPGDQHQGYDQLYVPQVGYTTGDLDIHDIVIEDSGRVVFANTKFGCLATLSDRHSFTPLWKPPFLSKLAPEDRCHLNGIAMVDGRVKYVTTVSASDVTDGWRDRRREGGCIIDVRSNETVMTGLSMPHSPRWYRDRLWVHNSGTGFFGSVDLVNRKFEPLTFCPGYLRGLAFAGDYAIVGLSQPRHEKTFSGLALDEELSKRQADPWCGLNVIDLRTGDIAQWVRIEGMVKELYDVVTIPGALRPMSLGFKTDEIQRLLTIGPALEL